MARRTNIGEVSSGTMRPEDLIPSFLCELRHQHPCTREHYNLVRRIASSMKADDYFDSEDCTYDLEALFDALDAYAPEGFYFGAHPGDGACYGYWLSERFDDDFDGLKVSDLADVPKGYTGKLLVVNDHGNVSMYHKPRRGKIRELWSLV